MTNIRVVTDSTGDIPVHIREQHQITMVPLKVHFGEETFLDAVTLQADEFFRKLTQTSVFPTTSQPSPNDFIEVYEEILADPESHIISIHLSSALSGTYQSAMIAKSMLEEKGERITVIDSRSASYGIGILVLTAAKAAQEGKSVEQCVEAVKQMRIDNQLYFCVDTLEFLQKGGRIGKAAAVLGSILNIKPILTVDDEGEVSAVDKVRGHKRALGRIVDMLKEYHGDRPVHVTLAHANAMDAAQSFAKLLEAEFNVKSVDYTVVGSVIGAHVGPGTVAVFMRPAE